MTEPRKLLSFEFLGLCLVTFVAYCNISVFYNLFSYLQTLGIQGNVSPETTIESGCRSLLTKQGLLP